MQLQCRPDDCHWSHCGLSFKVVSLKKHLSWEISFQQSHVTAERTPHCLYFWCRITASWKRPISSCPVSDESLGGQTVLQGPSLSSLSSHNPPLLLTAAWTPLCCSRLCLKDGEEHYTTNVDLKKERKW